MEIPIDLHHQLPATVQNEIVKVSNIIGDNIHKAKIRSEWYTEFQTLIDTTTATGDLDHITEDHLPLMHSMIHAALNQSTIEAFDNDNNTAPLIIELRQSIDIR